MQPLRLELDGLLFASRVLAFELFDLPVMLGLRDECSRLRIGRFLFKSVADLLPILVRGIHGHRQPHKDEAHDQNDDHEYLTEPIHVKILKSEKAGHSARGNRFSAGS